MEPKGMTLRAKLLAVFVLPTLALLALYGAGAYAVARSGLEAELGRRLVSIGQTLAADMSYGLTAKQLTRLDPSKERTLGRLRQTLETARDATGVRRVFLFDAQLKSLADSRVDVAFGEKLFMLEADRVELGRVFEDGSVTTSVLFSGEDGTRYKYAYAPVFLDGEPGEVVAAVGVEASASFFALLTNFASGLALFGVFAALLLAAAAAWLARRITDPVDALVEAAVRLGQGNLDAPVVDVSAGPPRDELEVLAHSFEEMRRGVLGRDRQMQMMLSGIAHEVRNPLGGMELFCGLLREDLEADGGEMSGEHLDKVRKIERELGYLSKVVTDFLDFARYRPLETERFSAIEFADEVAMLLYGPVAEAGCELSTKVDDGVELSADRERLRRAVINVVRNAYQACGEGGHLELRVLARGDERVIELADDGPGVPEDKVAELLTPFYTTKEKGSGLGLALTQKIVEQHGGVMELDSVVGQGTTVRFTLPFDPDAEAAAPAIPEGWLG
jgi:signal transduction histidine kinase